MKTLLTHHQPFHISIHVLSTQVIVESQPTSNGMYNQYIAQYKVCITYK
jgi:hypothetical protein